MYFSYLAVVIISGTILERPGSSVVIATDYELDGRGIESEVHPASCTMGTGFFPGIKRPVLTTHPLLALRLRMSRAIPLLPL
jgi:hypothetical protein